jgi:hypothetical protein
MSAGAKVETQDVDLRTTGKLRPVDNQGSCGSCTAFGASHAWQDYFTAIGCALPKLATQHILNCAISCNGGYPNAVFSWIQNTGQTTETCLKYRAVQNACNNNCDSGSASTCGGSATITQRLHTQYTCTTSEATMRAWLDAGYPMSIALTLMQKFYDHGSASVAANSVYPRSTGSTTVIGGHAMEIVGYGTLAGVPYWQMKNSWGATWGDAGYMKIRRGVNQGGIESNGACRPSATSCPKLSGSGLDLQSVVDMPAPQYVNVPAGEFNNSAPHIKAGVMPGGQVPAETNNNDMLNEATTFAIHVLLSTSDDQGGFGCLAALPPRTDQNITGAAMEEMDIVNEEHQGLNSVTVHAADQQVTQGVGYHFIFSFSTSNPKCSGASGTYDATVHITADGFLIMQNIFKTNPPAPDSGVNMTAVIAGSVAAGAVVLLGFTYCGYRHHKARKTINRLTEVQKDVFHRLSMIEASDPTVARVGLSRALEDTDLASPPAKPQHATSPNWHPLKNTTRV